MGVILSFISLGYIYTYPDIEGNFGFRLMTQNRMSNDKDLFYPIGIIRKLFRYGQKNARRAGKQNNDYEWFKHWIKDYVGEIGVITQEGVLPLTQVQRLEIAPADNSVTVITNDVSGNRHTVLTEKGVEVDLTVPMQAKEIREIHIDHSPTMAAVLSATKGSLPALNKLSDLIKDTAKRQRINIKPANFGKISKKLFADPERVENELLPLITPLKEELDILRGKCELKLMQAKYNLTKK